MKTTIFLVLFSLIFGGCSKTNETTLAKVKRIHSGMDVSELPSELKFKVVNDTLSICEFSEIETDWQITYVTIRVNSLTKKVLDVNQVTKSMQSQ